MAVSKRLTQEQEMHAQVPYLDEPDQPGCQACTDFRIVSAPVELDHELVDEVGVKCALAEAVFGTKLDDLGLGTKAVGNALVRLRSRRCEVFEHLDTGYALAHGLWDGDWM
ncbi:hypothetical protein Tdes44962_MAKER08141 [Teratosphaeria destructans]|uniref:Uncharacterized protein n=1 Tax=Teratosphaeria destructans TaxID=418781 RepID=A0A9W7W4V1_9PEZI|nr:hypothetical protein Tdes44962_MAKER08141 [Teratosphaeria destructans]